MDIKDARRIVKRIAEKEGIPVSEVVLSIECAMDEMKRDAYGTGDQEKIAKWEAIPHAGESPTAYEMIAYLSNEVVKRKGNAPA